mmetsp:Transcript_8176/g.27152  ORF Transcript_8176/g.27152 Transcript_8176/m.27152 type:complete len:205 (+) Transcript_8176:242-856(+)
MASTAFITSGSSNPAISAGLFMTSCAVACVGLSALRSSFLCLATASACSSSTRNASGIALSAVRAPSPFAPALPFNTVTSSAAPFAFGLRERGAGASKKPFFTPFFGAGAAADADAEDGAGGSAAALSAASCSADASSGGGSSSSLSSEAPLTLRKRELPLFLMRSLGLSPSSLSCFLMSPADTSPPSPSSRSDTQFGSKACSA